MAGAVKIKVAGRLYPVAFGYGAVRNLGKRWGVPGMFEVYGRLIGMLNQDVAGQSAGDQPSEADQESLGLAMLKFENLDMMADVAFEGICFAAGPDFEPEFGPDQVIEVLLADMELLSAVFRLFMESMPRPEKEKPAPGSKKKPTRKGS